jgi:hypothetical protein
MNADKTIFPFPIGVHLRSSAARNLFVDLPKPAWPAYRLNWLELVGSLTLARVVASFLYEVKPTDASTYAASIVVLAVSALAAWFPARRAATIDPTTALHYE